MSVPAYQPETQPRHRLPVSTPHGTHAVSTWVGVLPPRPGFPTATYVRPWVPGLSSPTLPTQEGPKERRRPDPAGERGFAAVSAAVTGALIFGVLATPVALFTLSLTTTC